MDLNMPGLNGWEFMEAFTQIEHLQPLPKIYIVSNSDNPKDMEKAEADPLVTGIKEKFLTEEFFLEVFENKQ